MADHNLLKTTYDLVCALVAYPDDVNVEITYEDEKNIELSISVNPNDMGRVIGRHGRIAKSIRIVIKAAAIRHNLRSDVKIVEPTED